MIKYLTALLILLLTPIVCFGAITFTDGKWETTFDCAEQDQSEGLSVTCDDMTGFSANTFGKYILTDGVADNWTESSTSNEWYYSPANDWTNPGLEMSVIVGTTEYFHPVKASAGSALGSLVAYDGSTGTDSTDFGDNDVAVTADTVYIYSTDDPDLETNGTVVLYWARSTYTADDYVSAITSPANNTAGLGGRGFRTLIANGLTINTGFLGLEFPSAQTELWIRFYVKLQDGFDWVPIESYGTGGCDPAAYPTMPGDQKHLFIKSGGTASSVATLTDNIYRIWAQGPVSDETVRTTGLGHPTTGTPQTGWTEIMGADLCTGGGSDGEWHMYEIHIKMNSSLGVADGVGQIWLDGVLKADETDVNWAGTSADSLDGWVSMDISENQRGVSNEGEVEYTDYDDIVIYNTVPPGRDAGDNPYIGPIVSTQPSATGINIQ